MKYGITNTYCKGPLQIHHYPTMKIFNLTFGRFLCYVILAIFFWLYTLDEVPSLSCSLRILRLFFVTEAGIALFSNLSGPQFNRIIWLKTAMNGRLNSIGTVKV